MQEVQQFLHIYQHKQQLELVNLQAPLQQERNQEAPVAAAAIVTELHPHDILLGRSGQANHPGNQWYRNLVRTDHALYRNVPGGTKLRVSKLIVEAVNQLVPPGRFLTLSSSLSSSTIWKVIPYEQAVTKTSQALRDSRKTCIGAIRGGRYGNGLSRGKTNTAPPS